MPEPDTDQDPLQRAAIPQLTEAHSKWQKELAEKRINECDDSAE